MARGRFVSNTLGGSRKFARLTGDFPRLLYVLLITHTDVNGRVDADPLWIRGQILTRIPADDDAINAALEEMHAVGLIHLYTANGAPYLEIVNFEEHNKVRADREAQATIPGPDGSTPATKPDRSPSTMPTGDRAGRAQRTTSELAGPAPEKVRSESGVTPAQVEVEVEVQGQVQVQAQEPPPHDDRPADPQPVEAAPRRASAPPGTTLQKAKTRERGAIRAIDQPYIDAWNDNRGPLPRILTLGRERERALDRLRRELGDEALDLFRDAARQVALEPSYREKGYGFGNLLSGGDAKVLKWAEKYRAGGGLTDADRRLANTAAKVAKAIGGLT